MSKTRKPRRHRHRYPAAALCADIPDAYNGIAIFAERLGVQRHTIHAWKRRGTLLSVYEADRYAIRLGHHPSHYWPTWFDDALAETNWRTTSP